MPELNKKTFRIEGMHCASCELIIEKKILSLPHIKTADASTKNATLNITYENQAPTAEDLNQIFQESGYTFYENNRPPEEKTIKSFPEYIYAAIIALSIIFIIYLLSLTGITGLISINENSTLPAVLGLGLIAGFSTCAALVGGLILSLSKQWFEYYPGKTTFEKLLPYLLFNIGRIISYTIFGAILGLIGKKIQIALTLSSILTIFVSLLMIILGLQMLNIQYFRNFKLGLPKKITRKISEDKKYQNKLFPILAGALTLLLPCGFTVTTEGLALISGSALRGALIMMVFAIGTLPALLLIGFSSVKMFTSRWANRFTLVAGILITIFGIYNINAQINVLTGQVINPFTTKSTNKSNSFAPELIDGKQVIKMTASTNGYHPSYFKLKKDVPVRWEITDIGTSGCTNAILSRALFPDVIELIPGKTSVKEFIPRKTGRFKFSCWMGMINGIFEVVE